MLLISGICIYTVALYAMWNNHVLSAGATCCVNSSVKWSLDTTWLRCLSACTHYQVCLFQFYYNVISKSACIGQFVSCCLTCLLPCRVRVRSGERKCFEFSCKSAVFYAFLLWKTIFVARNWDRGEGELNRLAWRAKNVKCTGNRKFSRVVELPSPINLDPATMYSYQWYCQLVDS